MNGRKARGIRKFAYGSEPHNDRVYERHFQKVKRLRVPVQPLRLGPDGNPVTQVVEVVCSTVKADIRRRVCQNMKKLYSEGLMKEIPSMTRM
jgi:hypothetical protein